MKKFYLDFETASRVDLKAVGTVRYAAHGSTYVQCLGWSLNGAIGVIREAALRIGAPLIQWLVDLANDPDVVFIAHNSFFDRHIWRQYMHLKLGYPDVPIERWRCTMVKSLGFGLPGALSKAAKMLHLETQKDLDGQANMLMLCRPMKAVKGTKGLPPFYTEETHPELFAKHYTYCEYDIRCMVELDEYVPDMSRDQLRVWFMDQRLNDRGVEVDAAAIEKAIEFVGSYRNSLSTRYKQITNINKNPTQRKFVLEWLRSLDYDITNTKKSTLKPMLKEGLFKDSVREGVEIVLATNKSSLAKYFKMDDLRSANNVVYELLQYWAAHTKRWGGRGIQPQNFPRPLASLAKHVDFIVECITECTYDGFEMMYGSEVPEALASALRSMIVARKGRHFKIGDYKQIEARILAYLTQETERLRMFRSGEDTYCKAAEPIYGRVIDPEVDKEERQVGKCSDLGLGFGGGINAFVTTSKQYNVDLRPIAANILASATPKELSSAEWSYNRYASTIVEDVVDKDTGMACDIIKQRWRAANPKIVEYWEDISAAAVEAIMNPETKVRIGPLTWFMNGPFLICKIPSGNFISYFRPEIHYDYKNRPYFSYRTGKPKEPVKHTYGGLLTENVVQFIAYEIMSQGLVRLENEGFTPALTVHDEGVTEDLDDDTELTLERFKDILETPVRWAPELPVEIEVLKGYRYCK